MKCDPSVGFGAWCERLARCIAISAAVAVLSVMTGCAGYDGKSLPIGASESTAVALMGKPTNRYPLPNGERLEYAKGPYGVETFMLDFDSKIGLVKREQVLDEKHFNAIRVGMTGNQVREIIGRPSRIQGLAFNRTLWAYRYQDFFCLWFEVSIETDGSVGDAGYGPRCDKSIFE